MSGKDRPSHEATRVHQRPLDGLKSGPAGWGMNPVREAGAGNEAATGMHLVSIHPGTSRGHHAHANATEWIVVFGGTGVLTWRAPVDGSLREAFIDGQGPVLYEIPPGVEHVITNSGQQDIYALVFYDHPSPETVPAETLPAMRKGESP